MVPVVCFQSWRICRFRVQIVRATRMVWAARPWARRRFGSARSTRCPFPRPLRPSLFARMGLQTAALLWRIAEHAGPNVVRQIRVLAPGRIAAARPVPAQAADGTGVGSTVAAGPREGLPVGSGELQGLGCGRWAAGVAGEGLGTARPANAQLPWGGGQWRMGVLLAARPRELPAGAGWQRAG